VVAYFLKVNVDCVASSVGFLSRFFLSNRSGALSHEGPNLRLGRRLVRLLIIQFIEVYWGSSNLVLRTSRDLIKLIRIFIIRLDVCLMWCWNNRSSPVTKLNGIGILSIHYCQVRLVSCSRHRKTKFTNSESRIFFVV